MLNKIQYLYTSLVDLLDVNEATLSGCLDIIVVPQPDGTLKSNSFHVRFGKGKVWKTKEKEVNIHVNDHLIPTKMVLGSAGEAYFLLSPPSSPPSSPSSSSSLSLSSLPSHRTRQPPSHVLHQMNLHPGQNKIQFSLSSPLSPLSPISPHSPPPSPPSLQASIFLWSPHDKIIISDIDGTITRSDLLGHLLPLFGNTWSQPGVPLLYHKIASQGYKLLYLSSRAIGQASWTREYLFNRVREGEREGLPLGPVILSPDRMVASLKREILYRTPDKFKIDALREILSLFGEEKAFYAGFGNRWTDVKSYREMGIAMSRIYIVDSEGIVTNAFNRRFASSYALMTDMVEHTFP